MEDRGEAGEQEGDTPLGYVKVLEDKVMSHTLGHIKYIHSV